MQNRIRNPEDFASFNCEEIAESSSNNLLRSACPISTRFDPRAFKSFAETSPVTSPAEVDEMD